MDHLGFIAIQRHKTLINEKQNTSVKMDTKKNSTFTFLSLLILIFLLSACDQVSHKNDKTASKAQNGTSRNDIQVSNVRGQITTLNQAAKRIAALSPHSVENVFSAGAGDLLVARSAYADYPEAANKLPIVSQYNSLNLEQLVELKPDLIIVWRSAIKEAALEKLRSLNIPIYISEINLLGDIAQEIINIGVLTGRSETANAAANDFLDELASLETNYSNLEKKKVFYQIAHSPLYTIGGPQIINHIINICGGENIFSDQNIKAPVVSKEAVVERNPDIIVYGNSALEVETLKQQWQEWEAISAVRSNHLYALNPDLISRASARIAIGAEGMCEAINNAR